MMVLGSLLVKALAVAFIRSISFMVNAYNLLWWVKGIIQNTNQPVRRPCRAIVLPLHPAFVVAVISSLTSPLTAYFSKPDIKQEILFTHLNWHYLSPSPLGPIYSQIVPTLLLAVLEMGRFFATRDLIWIPKNTRRTGGSNHADQVILELKIC